MGGEDNGLTLRGLAHKPEGSVGSHTTGGYGKGDLYLDSTATLFVCVASGAPGTWRRAITTAT